MCAYLHAHLCVRRERGKEGEIKYLLRGDIIIDIHATIIENCHLRRRPRCVDIDPAKDIQLTLLTYVVKYHPRIQILFKHYHGSVVPTMDPGLGGTEY